MIENAALRAIIAGGVGLVVWKVLAMLLVSARQQVWYYLWAAFVVALVVGVWTFRGLAKPGPRPHA